MAGKMRIQYEHYCWVTKKIVTWYESEKLDDNGFYFRHTKICAECDQEPRITSRLRVSA